MEAWPMSGIVVSVANPTDRGRLYSRYDNSAGILVVQSRVDRPWPFGVDIDGRLVFDLDRTRTLANFDLHVPKNRWRKGRIEARVRPDAVPGDLIFTPETIAAKSFSLPLSVTIAPSGRHLAITFGEREPDCAVSLSEFCVAFLAMSDLVGFMLTDIA